MLPGSRNDPILTCGTSPAVSPPERAGSLQIDAAANLSLAATLIGLGGRIVPSVSFQRPAWWSHEKAGFGRPSGTFPPPEHAAFRVVAIEAAGPSFLLQRRNAQRENSKRHCPIQAVRHAAFPVKTLMLEGGGVAFHSSFSNVPEAPSQIHWIPLWSLRAAGH